jgi:hypothetical protein
MPRDLTARTTPGAQLVALAETLATELAPRAAVYDLHGTFAFDSFAAVKQTGYLVAPSRRSSAASAPARSTTSSSLSPVSPAVTPR